MRLLFGVPSIFNGTYNKDLWIHNYLRLIQGKNIRLCEDECSKLHSSLQVSTSHREFSKQQYSFYSVMTKTDRTRCLSCYKNSIEKPINLVTVPALGFVNLHAQELLEILIRLFLF